MKNYQINKRNNNIVEIKLNKYPDSHLCMQLLNSNIYCAISTYVNPNDRGQGIGKLLYQSMLDYVRSQNAKFNAMCPFIVDLADQDKSIKDIYVTKIG
ncbi:MAG: N-acetyltransferase [Mycoplasmataceae bacterium]|jgi:predicted GNAT family acetyltransferase|nr:N-acetyltransferase [Mycoplasmataceae bacterium]